MRVISIKTLRDFWQRYPDAEQPLRDWFGTTEAAEWRNFLEVRQSFGRADTATVKSGNIVTIFDIGGNKYRLITAVHYNTQTVYAMMVLTHKEYSRNRWKDQL